MNFFIDSAKSLSSCGHQNLKTYTFLFMPSYQKLQLRLTSPHTLHPVACEWLAKKENKDDHLSPCFDRATTPVLGAPTTRQSQDLRSAECAGEGGSEKKNTFFILLPLARLTTRILRNSPLPSVTRVWNLRKKLKKKRKKDLDKALVQARTRSISAWWGFSSLVRKYAGTNVHCENGHQVLFFAGVHVVYAALLR